MASSIERVPSAILRRLHRRHRGQLEHSIRSTSLHDEPRRSPRRRCGDATERARHDEFATLRYGIGGEQRLLPEVQNPDRRGGRGGRRIDAHGRCVARDETAQARVPPAVRPCARGRHADAACHGLRRPGAVFRFVDKPDIMLGLAFTLSLASGEDLLVYCMYHPIGYSRGLARVDLLSIYCTVVVFLFHSSGH